MKSLSTLALMGLLMIASATQAATITLSSGDVLNGTIIERTDAQIVLQHPVLGNLPIAMENITAIVDDAPAAETATAEQVVEAAPEPVEPEPTGFFAGWESSLELGFNYEKEGDEDVDFRIGFDTKKETDTDRWIADAGYYFALEGSERTDNEFTAGLTKDWLIPDSKWFYYATGRYDFDDFEDWEHRLTGGGGVGYMLIEEENLTVELRGGMGFAREFGSNDENIKPEGQFGADLEWQINEDQSLVADTWVYPDLGDLGEFRITSSAAWQIKIDRDRGLSLKFGIENEYESDVDEGESENDFRGFGALVWDF